MTAMKNLWAMGLCMVVCLFVGLGLGAYVTHTHRSESPQLLVSVIDPKSLSLAVDGDGSLLKVGGGLFRSTDQGKTWRPQPLPADLHPEQVRWVATSPGAPFYLYAAGPGAGVLRSDKDRRTWSWISAGLPSQMVTALAAHSFRPDTVFVYLPGYGIYRTEDGGGRWQRMDAGPPAPVVALVHSTLAGSMNTGWLYASTPKGPYLSMDCF